MISTPPIPFPAAPPRVLQSDLERLLALRAQAKGIENDAAAIESRVRQAIEAGARIEPGLHVAFLRDVHRDGHEVGSRDFRQLIVR